ncbi:flagellar hook protein FlgE [Gellertiella hungarica]|uniref:Flagellar hook protein FlgE n=1 Tax=Gellertiella hungarica TaxID=1572859 RepID=A0A7W6J3P2_9HYPH|nr:flagellar hook protein FlgE [Gellertiella hungarica]MBB4064137.1 flagellar hook protein FlgE [Gellertiella hungarica]
MGLFGTMNTAISGMNAQSNRLSTVSDNIANSDSIGYKRSKVHFSSFLASQYEGSYNSGSVETVTTRDVSIQGDLTRVSSGTSIAVNGRGFFVVQDDQGANFLTRAGDFAVDENGDLVNAAGFKLLGYSFEDGAPATQINALTGMRTINMRQGAPHAAATKEVTFTTALDVRKPVVDAANSAGENNADSTFTHKTSIVAYDSLGREVKYDVYFTKLADAVGGSNPADHKWEVAIYRADKATDGGFPYTSVPADNVKEFTFDANGNINSDETEINITDSDTVPAQSIRFDFSKLNVKASEFAPSQHEVDGSKASWAVKAAIDKDGTVYAVYPDGTREPRYRIPLADVPSPDRLEALSGNVFQQTLESGPTITGFPGEGIFGQTISGMVEKSNVDMSEELTDMIQAQRNYTANSKVFQTGSELMDVLVNLKR